jgi:asparagine synthase (glutamine-hydrolysing)
LDFDSFLSKLKMIIKMYDDETYLKKQGIFNAVEVKKIIHAFYNGKKERAEKIWYLLMFQMWFDKWMK